MAKHPLDENRNRRVTESLIVQVGDICGGVKFDAVEFPSIDLRLSSRTFVDADLEIDAFGLDGAVDQRAGAVVRTAGHGKSQRHYCTLKIRLNSLPSSSYSSAVTCKVRILAPFSRGFFGPMPILPGL